MDEPSPVVLEPRARWLHWAAWLASGLALVTLGFAAWGDLSEGGIRDLGRLDLALSLFFLVEFFTRSGWRRFGWRYAATRWFDFVAIVPAGWLVSEALAAPWVVWTVFVARAVRLVDRSLGDGFVLRHVLALVEGLEEEVSDRVVVKILSRVQGELVDARFGNVAAEALRKNRDAILERVYREQLRDAGLLGSFASITGLQGALERSERRLFDSIIEMVGSPETDAMVADIVGQTLERAKREIGQRSWRSRFLGRPAKAVGS